MFGSNEIPLHLLIDLSDAFVRNARILASERLLDCRTERKLRETRIQLAGECGGLIGVGLEFLLENTGDHGNYINLSVWVIRVILERNSLVSVANPVVKL